MYGKYLVLFAILFTGWFLRKIDFIDDRMNHSMNKLVVYFAYPCLIVHNIGTLDMTKDLIIQFGQAFACTLVLFYLYGLITMAYAKVRKFPSCESPVAQFAMAAPNDGFMGFPVAIIFFGETGLLLMLAHNAAMNFFTFTYGTSLLRRMKEGEGRKMNAMQLVRAGAKLLTNPNIIAMITGFIISLLGGYIPAPVDEYLLYIGNVSTPMAMIFIGSSLTAYSFRDIIRDRVSIEGSLVKLVLLPLFTAACMYFVPVGPLIKCTVSLGIAFPSAAVVSMLAEQEGLEAGVASKILFLSTVASIVTVPAFMNLITAMFM